MAGEHSEVQDAAVAQEDFYIPRFGVEMFTGPQAENLIGKAVQTVHDGEGAFVDTPDNGFKSLPQYFSDVRNNTSTFLVTNQFGSPDIMVVLPPVRYHQDKNEGKEPFDMLMLRNRWATWEKVAAIDSYTKSGALTGLEGASLATGVLRKNGIEVSESVDPFTALQLLEESFIRENQARQRVSHVKSEQKKPEEKQPQPAEEKPARSTASLSPPPDHVQAYQPSGLHIPWGAVVAFAGVAVTLVACSEVHTATTTEAPPATIIPTGTKDSKNTPSLSVLTPTPDKPENTPLTVPSPTKEFVSQTVSILGTEYTTVVSPDGADANAVATANNVAQEGRNYICTTINGATYLVDTYNGERDLVWQNGAWTKVEDAGMKFGYLLQKGDVTNINQDLISPEQIVNAKPMQFYLRWTGNTKIVNIKDPAYADHYPNGINFLAVQLVTHLGNSSNGKDISFWLAVVQDIDTSFNKGALITVAQTRAGGFASFDVSSKSLMNVLGKPGEYPVTVTMVLNPSVATTQDYLDMLCGELPSEIGLPNEPPDQWSEAEINRVKFDYMRSFEGLLGKISDGTVTQEELDQAGFLTVSMIDFRIDLTKK